MKKPRSKKKITYKNVEKILAKVGLGSIDIRYEFADKNHSTNYHYIMKRKPKR